MIKKSFQDDTFVKLGRYWDDQYQLDILAKTKSGKIIVGSTKYTNSKVKKTELTRLKTICEELDIKADIFVLFSKKGFTSELKSLKGESLRLFTPRNFTLLID